MKGSGPPSAVGRCSRAHLPAGGEPYPTAERLAVRSEKGNAPIARKTQQKPAGAGVPQAQHVAPVVARDPVACRTEAEGDARSQVAAPRLGDSPSRGGVPQMDVLAAGCRQPMPARMPAGGTHWLGVDQALELLAGTHILDGNGVAANDDDRSCRQGRMVEGLAPDGCWFRAPHFPTRLRFVEAHRPVAVADSHLAAVGTKGERGKAGRPIIPIPPLVYQDRLRPIELPQAEGERQLAGLEPGGADDDESAVPTEVVVARMDGGWRQPAQPSSRLDLSAVDRIEVLGKRVVVSRPGLTNFGIGQAQSSDGDVPQPLPVFAQADFLADFGAAWR